MVDLLLVRSNDQKSVYGDTSKFVACEPPFWIATIAAFARQDKEISVAVLDAEALNLSPEDTVTRISEISPAVIGLLVTGTNLSASTWKMHGAGILARKIKESFSAKIFMWGLHPSALPDQTLKEEDIDFVIRGENFDSIVQLVKTLKAGDNNFADIPGLFYKTAEGKVQGNFAIKLQTDMDALPMAAWDMLPMEKYHAHNWHKMGEKKDKPNGYGIIATSLGCPFNCSFCAISALFDQKRVRYKSAKTVADEIGLLVEKYNVYYIKIIDECFVLNRKHVHAICDELIKRNYDVNIWAYARVDTVDPETLDKLAKANIKWLCYGIESVSDRSLKDVKKGQYNSQKIKDSLRMTHEAGINVLANYMFGLPEDDMESMKDTLAFARETNCEWINLYATMAYPGSKLYFDCIKNNVPLPESWLGYSQYSYECMPLPTKYLSGKEVLQFRDYAFNAFFEDNDAYFNLIREKFSAQDAENIKNMTKTKLRRKILGD